MGTVSHADLKEDLIFIIAKLAEQDRDSVSLEHRIREDLGMDSLKSMEAISRITELYDVDPDLDELAELKTVGEIFEYMLKQVG